MTDLSIAIPSWNTKDLLDQCLRAVKRSARGLRAEIVVVDNASSDGSADMVARKHADVMLLRNQVNRGFAAACNLALDRSDGRHFMLLNPDTIVLEDALRTLVFFMDEHPAIGAAGCRLLNSDGSLQRSCSCFPSVMTELLDALYLSKLFPRSRSFGRYAMSYWGFGEAQAVDWLGGSCLIVRRKAIDEIGPLDEGFFMYTEEADLCYRLWKRGWPVFYYPEAKAIHMGGASAKKSANLIRLLLYTGRNRFIRKHQGERAATRHRLVVGLGATMRLPVLAAKRLLRRDAGQLSVQTRLLDWAIRGRFSRPIGVEGLQCG